MENRKHETGNWKLINWSAFHFLFFIFLLFGPGAAG